MFWIELGAGDQGFAYRLEKHKGKDLMEVYETDSLNDALVEANSWVHCFTQYPPHLPPVVNPKEETLAVWEDWMDEV